MHDLIGRNLVERIHRTHDNILKSCAPLSNDNMTHRISQTAPPIGWHLWHIARWADHFQASFPKREQIWQRDNIAVEWMLDTTLLGPMESGMGMPILMATELVQKVGHVRLVDYARLTFHACRDALHDIDVEALQSKRTSFATWAMDGERIIYAAGAETTLIADFTYQLTHANRHLGMIEALIGATLERKGSASI
ncbi:MAG: hypothetical protein Q9P01_20995 [Anaerolineae bacterium]|nr:hypothetical protein [Anaerolineae bacterium]MDQ7037225.1 hypothetical protein [Anaerolineae bacterium]